MLCSWREQGPATPVARTARSWLFHPYSHWQICRHGYNNKYCPLCPKNMQNIIQFSIVFKFLNTIHSCICKRIYEFWLFRKNWYIFDVGQGGLKGTMTQKTLLHQNIFNNCELLLMGLKRYTGKYVNVWIYAKKDARVSSPFILLHFSLLHACKGLTTGIFLFLWKKKG